VSPGKTNAVRLLEQAGIPFTTREYPVNEGALDAVSVARSLGAEPERVFKTLVTVSDSRLHFVFCLPGSAELDLKKAARATGARRIGMLPLRELQPLTGYVHGGCSPIGMKKSLPTWIDETAELYDTIYISGGARGLQVEISPADLIALVGATCADVTH
jgi:Cys-tRNA(Pro)/Cys-tRNA(Cys) deacylase